MIIDNRLVVVKAGMDVVSRDNNHLDLNNLENLVAQIVNCHRQGWKAVLITAGAIAAGHIFENDLKYLAKNRRPQIFASLGQPRLMSFYSNCFEHYGIKVAQLLITRSAFADRIQYFSVRDTLNGLLANKVVPIVNDNDIFQGGDDPQFSDNDLLAAYTAGMLNAECMINLIGEDGLFVKSADGSITLIEQIDSDSMGTGALQNLTQHSTRPFNSSKSLFVAGRLLASIGIPMLIANGRRDNTLELALSGRARCTAFVPKERQTFSGVRKWLSTGAVPQGAIVVSPVGVAKLTDKKERGSLLAAGVERVIGEFESDEVVSLCDQLGRLLGYGISRYSSRDLINLRGQEDIIVVHANYFYGTDYGVFDQ